MIELVVAINELDEELDHLENGQHSHADKQAIPIAYIYIIHVFHERK